MLPWTVLLESAIALPNFRVSYVHASNIRIGNATTVSPVIKPQPSKFSFPHALALNRKALFDP